MVESLDGPVLSAGHRLPVELVQQICILAAEDDRRCAHQLAFVSRAICQMTAKARWRVITITNVNQYLALYRELQAIPDKEYNLVVEALHQVDDAFKALQMVNRPLKGESEYAKDLVEPVENFGSTFDVMTLAKTEKVRVMRRVSTISLPSIGEPHESIRHLYVDLPESHSRLKCTAGPSSGWRALVANSSEAITAYAALNKGRIDDTKFKGRKPGWTKGVGRLLEGLDDLCLDHLSLGAGAKKILRSVSRRCCIKEVTLVYTSYSENDDPIPASLQRLHIIGLDSLSKMSGIPPPWNDLAKAGSEGSYSLRLSHLRFDTRKFSLKPAEIFASRLRPLLQEITFESQANPTAGEDVQDEYRHSGPRHAAPSRGAGYSNHYGSGRSSLIPVHHLRGDARADYLREKMGVGRLDYLQFAWDPMDASERREEDIPPHQRVRYSAVAQQGGTTIEHDTGGWPREMRGAWTERSDRDVAPSFAIELRDAINFLYGWHTSGIESAAKFSARVDAMLPKERKNVKNVAFVPDHAGDMVAKIKDGCRELDRSALLRMQNQLTQEMMRRGEEVSCKLQYGVRAPQSLIHLGGKAPFEPEDRLALFLDRARGGKGAWP